MLDGLLSTVNIFATRRDVALHANLTPEIQKYEALKKIMPSLSDGHLAMLKAHCRAPNRCLTATQLADAAGYANDSAANLQHGFVGKLLWEELPTDFQWATTPISYTHLLWPTPEIARHRRNNGCGRGGRRLLPPSKNLGLTCRRILLTTAMKDTRTAWITHHLGMVRRLPTQSDRL